MPRELDARIKSLEQKLEVLASELDVANKLRRANPDLSLTKSRMVLEKLVKKIYELETQNKPSITELSSLIKSTEVSRVVPDRIKTRMHSIRAMSNLGVHGQDIKESDALMVLNNLCEVLEWFIDSYDFVEKKDKESKRSSIFTFLSIALALIAVAFTFMMMQKSKEVTPAVTLDGSYILEMVTEETSYGPFEGMNLKYKMYFIQNGFSIKAQGEKHMENGTELSGKRRTQLDLQGSLKEDEIMMNFKNYGSKRSSVGQIYFEDLERDTIYGRFETTAANSKGRAILIKE